MTADGKIRRGDGRRGLTKGMRLPARRGPSLQLSESQRGADWRANVQPGPFRALQVLIPSAAPVGALSRALEAARPIAERGARVAVVHGPRADSSFRSMDTAVHAVVARFPFAGLVENPLSGADPSRPVTLVASPHVCLDVASTESMMLEISESEAGAAVAPAFTGSNGAELQAMASPSAPLVWMVRTESLGSHLQRVRTLRAARVLVPCPAEVPRIRTGAKEREPLAT